MSSFHIFYKSADKVAANWKRMFIKWVTNRRLLFIVQLRWLLSEYQEYIWREHVMPQRPSWQKKHFYGWKKAERILKPQHKKANATKQHHKPYLFISTNLPPLFLCRLSTPIIIIIVTTEYTFQWGLLQGMIIFHKFSIVKKISTK